MGTMPAAHNDRDSDIDLLNVLNLSLLLFDRMTAEHLQLQPFQQPIEVG